MSSQLKIEANRRNAQLSTGPTSPEGKAIVADNARSHGLCSRDTVLPEENPDDFDALLAGLLDEFQPATSRQEALVRQLASAEWRLRRIARIETGVFVSRLELERKWEKCRKSAPILDRTPDQERYDVNTRLLGLVFAHNCESEVFTKLMRYENSIRRAFFKALAELKAASAPPSTQTTKQSQTPAPASPLPPPPPDAIDPQPETETGPASPPQVRNSCQPNRPGMRRKPGTDMSFRRSLPEIRCLSPVCPVPRLTSFGYSRSNQ